MENVVKEYSRGMDLKGARVVEFKVSDKKNEITKDKDGKIVKASDKKENENYTTEEKPVNSDDVKNLDNYNASKSIIEKRLNKLGVNNYIIKLEEETGKIIVELPENDNTDHIVSNIGETGKFQIVDSEDTEKVLMDNNDIKNASVLYNNTKSGTVVYLNIEFNNQGKEKLKNISEEYKTIEENKDSNTEAEEAKTSEESKKDEQKKITMKIDDNEMITTSFDDTMENGSIQLSMGQASTDKTKINESVKSSSTIATILTTGNMPVVYETESNQYIETDLAKYQLIKVGIGLLAVAAIALIVLIIKYKKAGIMSVIAFIGFVAVYSLLIRYTNVMITLEGLAGILVIIVLNYVFNYRLLGRINGKEGEERAKAYNEEFISFCVKSIPICILSIVFSFMNWTPITSFGMTIFWGLILEAIYNITVTKSFLKQ